MKAPELLSPAGTHRSMRYAFAYGADAVYAGQPRYSLRVRNNEFTSVATLGEAIAEAHDQGRRFYLASNIAAHNDKVRTYLRDLEPVVALAPDALIMSDPGLIMLVRERWPDLPIHLSVQANAVNWATVRFWQQQGLQRVILSRELSLEEIADIREQVPAMELEAFVHGALCIAYSGRCLLSGYINHRDANQGACTNACRWSYDTISAREDETGELVPATHAEGAAPTGGQRSAGNTGTGETAPPMLLRELSRPDELIPAFEDEHGTYIMNSRDLRAVQHVATLCSMGIHSLKIEGRTKSHYYVARTAQVYRRAIDEAMAGRPFDWQLMEELEALSNRGYTEGFYRRHPPQAYQAYAQRAPGLHQQFVGEVIDCNDHWFTVDVKNRFECGDLLQLMTPAGNHSFVLDGMENQDGRRVDIAPGSGHTVRVPRAGLAIEDSALRYALISRQHAQGTLLD